MVRIHLALIYRKITETASMMKIPGIAAFSRVTVVMASLAGLLLVGVAAIVVGFLKAKEAVHLIVLERQGSCDYLPCANEMTYVTAAAFALLALGGIGLLACVFVLLATTRSRDE